MLMKIAITALSLLVIGVSTIVMIPNTNQRLKNSIAGKKIDSCMFNGKNLFGKIQFVDYANQADIKVQMVNNFPDLKVKFVDNFADQCGEWKIVEHHGDLKVYVVERFADIKIKIVENFPGLP